MAREQEELRLRAAEYKGTTIIHDEHGRNVRNNVIVAKHGNRTRWVCVGGRGQVEHARSKAMLPVLNAGGAAQVADGGC